MRSAQYNNGCPLCRTEICEPRKEHCVQEEEEEEDDDEDDDDDEDEDDEEHYHCPINIETLAKLVDVISEIAGTCRTSWILAMISMTDDYTSSLFEFETHGNYDANQWAFETKEMIMFAIDMYKRSVLLKKHCLHHIQRISSKI
jgi:ABC-type Zn2+ transport system substrate-binding protein/surface adhesin